MIQTNTVVDRLKELYPGMTFEIESMSTTGDKILDKALSKIGEKSLFTKELEFALMDKRVDLVVHSLKDLPSTLPDGMALGAVIKRDSPYDAVVMHPSNKGKTLKSLPENSVIGTSSVRRAAQLKKKYPHLKFKDIRGNLNTRLRKLDEADTYAAIILAVAGLDRMGWQDRISQELQRDECMYAISQGAMAVECRLDDQDTLDLISKLHHTETLTCCVAERAFLRQLEGGCSVPVAIYTELKSNRELFVQGGVFSLDGTECVLDSDTVSLPTEDVSDEPPRKKPTSPRMFASIVAQNAHQGALEAAEKIGRELAARMLKNGADVILNAARATTDAEIKKSREDAEAKLKQEEEEKAKLEEKNKVEKGEVEESSNCKDTA